MTDRHLLSLAVFDIDGTLRTAKSPWIHLHEHLGFSKEGLHHRDLFFSGAIDYKEWVDRDASLWKGSSREKILGALETNPLKPGAIELLRWFRDRCIPLIGISSGLDVFNRPIQDQFGFEFIKSNELLFDHQGVCLGQAKIHVEEGGKGPILKQILQEREIDPKSVVAFGDGTADIQMFELVGLSVAVAPHKEAVRQAASHVLDTEPLDMALRFLEGHFWL